MRVNRSTVSQKTAPLQNKAGHAIIAMTTSCHWWRPKILAGFELRLLGDVFVGLSDRVVDPGNLFADAEFSSVGCHCAITKRDQAFGRA
jgi:hypothetical protein